jgi:hypothetical protein
MKNKIYIIAIILFSSLSLRSQAPAWQWAKSAGGSLNDGGGSIAVDANGNTYVTGAFESATLTLGSITLTNSGSGAAVFIAKYNASGNVIWAKSAGGTYEDIANSIKVDANGNSIITGYFTSPDIIFGSFTLTNADNTGDTQDGFIVKYNSLGDVVWAKHIGGINDDAGNGIALDANGNAYITGSFSSPTIIFGSTTLTNASNSDDIFIAKYDTLGNVLWAKRAGGIYMDEGNSISVDANGNSIITGDFSSPTLIFGATTLISDSSLSDIFIAKYDVSGNVLWAKSAGGIVEEQSFSIAMDAIGNSYITGYSRSPTLVFGSTTLTNAGMADMFIVKYDVSGNVLWAKNAGGTKFEMGYGVAVDAGGNVYATGFFASPTITFGSTVLTQSDSGYTDSYIVKYGASGNVLWAKKLGGDSDDYTSSVAVDPNGNLFITGEFMSSTIAFGSTIVTNANVGSFDFFVAKLGSTLGIASVNNSYNAINIFPNPGNGQINITSSNTIDAIEITNPLGQTIYQTKPNEKNISFQLEHDGIYFVTVTSNKQTTTRKLVIQQ